MAAKKKRPRVYERKPNSKTRERLILLEDLLLRGYSEERASEELARHCGIRPKEVREHYIPLIRRAWSDEASRFDREERRSELRKMFLDAYRRAATRTRTKQVRKAITKPDGTVEVVTVDESRPAPDFSAMAKFARLLMDLDGLNEKTINVHARGDLSSMLMEAATKRRKMRERAEQDAKLVVNDE